jgi:hypothetical protein
VCDDGVRGGGCGVRGCGSGAGSESVRPSGAVAWCRRLRDGYGPRGKRRESVVDQRGAGVSRERDGGATTLEAEWARRAEDKRTNRSKRQKNRRHTKRRREKEGNGEQRRMRRRKTRSPLPWRAPLPSVRAPRRLRRRPCGTAPASGSARCRGRRPADTTIRHTTEGDLSIRRYDTRRDTCVRGETARGARMSI